MGKEKYYQYFVEGEDEKKLVDVLKSDMKLIVSGKSQVFNVTQQKLTRLRVMNLKPGTTVVLIFDADAGKGKLCSYRSQGNTIAGVWENACKSWISD